MAKKVEGYYTMAHDGTPLVSLEKNVYFTKHCTTVLHEGEPERVFAESEVRSMLRSITHCTGSPVASIHINEVRRVFAEDYGITLDPA